MLVNPAQATTPFVAISKETRSTVRWCPFRSVLASGRALRLLDGATVTRRWPEEGRCGFLLVDRTPSVMRTLHCVGHLGRTRLLNASPQGQSCWFPPGICVGLRQSHHQYPCAWASPPFEKLAGRRLSALGLCRKTRCCAPCIMTNVQCRVTMQPAALGT